MILGWENPCRPARSGPFSAHDMNVRVVRPFRGKDDIVVLQWSVERFKVGWSEQIPRENHPVRIVVTRMFYYTGMNGGEPVPDLPACCQNNLSFARHGKTKPWHSHTVVFPDSFLCCWRP